MSPTSLDKMKQELLQDALQPYLQRINELEKQLNSMLKKIDELQGDISERDNYINQLESKLEKLSSGERITRPIKLRKHNIKDDDPISFILGA